MVYKSLKVYTEVSAKILIYRFTVNLHIDQNVPSKIFLLLL